MKNKDLEKILEALLETVKEGIHILDDKGITYMYSSEMAKLEFLRTQDVIGKSYREVFSDISLEESTINKAYEGKTSKNIRQTYYNKFGKQVTTLNTTKPIYNGDKIVAVIEVADNITKIKDMTETIQDLRVKSRPVKKEEASIRQYRFSDIIGENYEFKKQIKIAKKASKSKGNVFIYGETGTGKELFAQSIHYEGNRANKPFLAQNCAALPETLLEGILFGTVKGAFMGAENRIGLFEQANGGTLFLDEISAMPYGLQSKLLRVLQEGYVRRIGSTKDLPINVRIIASVNEDPYKLMRDGFLRKDLYYRLSVINLSIPPLRRRRDDLSLLIPHFIKKHQDEGEFRVKGFTRSAYNMLMDYSYPGNVRELENIISSIIMTMEKEGPIEASHVVLREKQQEQIKSLTSFDPKMDSLDSYLRNIEEDILRDYMIQSMGNVSKAAEYLGIKRQTLQHKLKKYGL